MTDKYQNITLKGKIIALTGGYGYLGEGIALSMAEHSGEVYVFGRNKEKFDQTFNHERIHFIPCDVSSLESITSAVNELIEKTGRLDVFINNAFYLLGSSDQENISEEVWNQSIDGTLNSVHRCIKVALPHLKKTEGNVINVASMYGMQAPDMSIYEEVPQFTNPAYYGAAKAGVIQLTKYYASLLGKYQINVNSVSPGPFPSPAVQESEVFVKALKKRTALNRIGHQREIGGPFVFLASDAASFVTGHNLVVDGGWTIK